MNQNINTMERELHLVKRGGNKLDNEDENVIGWEMHEFLENKKDFTWYALLFLIAAILATLSYLIVGEIIAPISISLMAVAVALFSFKKPDRQKYTLTSFGLKVNSRLYEYSSFKAFSLLQDQGMAVIYLITSQRFMPPLTIYLPTSKDKAIIKKLSKYIAYTPSNVQWWDRFTHYLGF